MEAGTETTSTDVDPEAQGKPSRRGWTAGRDWLTQDRYRVFTAFAAGALIVCIVLLFLPDNLITIGLAFLFAGLAALLGLLGLATWWAERRGLTDGHDLWDADADDTDRPDDLLRGFGAFGEAEDEEAADSGDEYAELETDTDADGDVDVEGVERIEIPSPRASVGAEADGATSGFDDDSDTGRP